METYTTGSGQVLKVHDEGVCQALKRGLNTCVIHARADTHMKQWPTHWRSDWGGFMEVICPHGIGHGCDGCCSDPAKAQDTTGFRYRQGGMMRCCIKTLTELYERTVDDKTTSVTVAEGAELKCEWCQSRIVFRDGAWEWDKSRSWYTPEAKAA
jgi:hypothetical protein